jgi:hypothetical protein
VQECAKYAASESRIRSRPGLSLSGHPREVKGKARDNACTRTALRPKRLGHQRKSTSGSVSFMPMRDRWTSVRSRDRCVLHPAPLISRKPRSPQGLNRPRPLARPTPSDPPRRSMSASTIRPVRHSIPLPLSIVARPHEAGLIRSWRADSLAFVWLYPGITPCCRSRLRWPARRDSLSYRSSFRRPIPQPSGPGRTRDRHSSLTRTTISSTSSLG